MSSIALLRAAAAATLGLGVADLVVLNAVLGPSALADDTGSPAVVVAHVSEPPAPPPSAPPLPVVPQVIEPREVQPPRAEASDERVYFATLSNALGSDAIATLQRIVASAGPSGTFTLEGHADVRGAEGLNLTLSKSRALAVANELARLGVARTRISVDFVGSAGASPTGELWRDRRVDIRVERGPR